MMGTTRETGPPFPNCLTALTQIVEPRQRTRVNKSVDIYVAQYSATRGLLARDLVILNHGQVTRTNPVLAPAPLTTTPHQREDV
ncbi:hypothetical protein TNCV_2126361 [Trichonephila clavipes]|nr:hypothetical protein TNCV_2126361 [Trichonephila clavipes]